MSESVLWADLDQPIDKIMRLSTHALLQLLVVWPLDVSLLDVFVHCCGVLALERHCAD